MAEEGVKKLRTYKKLKHHFGIEHYLETINTFNIRKCISSFSIRAHKLRSECGKYKGEKPEERLCAECNEHNITYQKVYQGLSKKQLITESYIKLKLNFFMLMLKV